MQASLLLCDFAVAAGITWLSNRFALSSFRRAKDAHWTERARQLWPARIAAAIGVWLLPADIVLAQRLLGAESAPPWPLAALAAWLGALAGTYSFDHEIFPWLTTRAWLHHVLSAWAIRFTTWFLFFGIIALMPKELDWRAWALAGFFPVWVSIWVNGGLVWACRKLRLLSSAPERLQTIVKSVSSKMQTPFRQVWLLHSAAATAFALPYTKELLFSERLINLHPDEEVAAICAHELGHLNESRLMRVGRLAGLLFYLPLLLIKPVALNWGPGGVLVLALVSWLFYDSSRRLSRYLEKRADRIAQNNEADPGVYAQALARLHEENLVPAVLPRQRTHPDLYDRLLAAGVQPDFPRPEKPSTYGPRLFVLSILLGVLIVANLEQTSARPDNPPSVTEPAPSTA